MNLFGVTGWKNAGKTGLMERLVTEITGRGFTVSTLKHAHHSFDVDHPGKDSHRHRVAGASQVLLASGTRWALMTELRDEPEPTLADLIAKLDPVDLILVEGTIPQSRPSPPTPLSISTARNSTLITPPPSRISFWRKSACSLAHEL